MTKVLFITQLCTALFMTGLIWMVQLVHYPLFAAVGAESYQKYQQQHVKKISWIVIPIMTLELITALLLWSTDLGSDNLIVTAALGALGIAWLSTALLQVPCHNALRLGFDAKIHQRLVRTNWLRAFAWTTRSALLLTMLSARL